MPACRHCEAEHAAEELVRHESRAVVLVHCPDCGCLMGRYRRHGDDPQSDTRRT